jgi:hypothetical protein
LHQRSPEKLRNERLRNKSGAVVLEPEALSMISVDRNCRHYAY